MDSSTARFQDSLLRTISGNANDKVSGCLELIREATRFDALTLASADKKNRPVIGSIGHEPQVASYLSSDKFESCPVQNLQFSEPGRLLTWDDVDFASTSHAQEVLVPSGYRNGISVPITTSGAPRVGVLHCNIADSKIDPSISELLLGLRPVLNHLIEISSTTQVSSRLSQREEEILARVAEGLTNPEIAEDLYLSRSTVGTHIERILRKIQVSNRVQAAIWWDRHGTGTAQAA